MYDRDPCILLIYCTIPNKKYVQYIDSDVYRAQLVVSLA